MKNSICKNCENQISGEYCSQCGQKDIELLKFKKLIKDFLDHHLDLDSRLFITLKYLATKPGYLTNEYWSGRRTRYIPPFKIYLFDGVTTNTILVFRKFICGLHHRVLPTELGIIMRRTVASWATHVVGGSSGHGGARSRPGYL